MQASFFLSALLACQAPEQDPSFRRHVLPLISRIGCNGRACHGSFAGQGGFQLSLFGYDFAKDHKEITGDEKVRIDPAAPEKSLLLLKPTAQVEHEGERRISKGSWEYALLLKWIQKGAVEDSEKTGDFDRLDVAPARIVFRKIGDKAQLKITARWRDGTVEDVSRITRFRTNDESVAVISATGEVTCVGLGDTHVVAFYDNGITPVPVLMPYSSKPVAKVAAATPVDGHIEAKLRDLGIVPSALCTDAEFLRRASLDATGTLPTPAEVTAFLADKAADKRARKVEELLASPAHAAWWAVRFSDITGNSAAQLRGRGGAENAVSTQFGRQWYDWIRDRLARNVPYDEIAAGLIVATSRTAPEQEYEAYAKEMGSYYRKEEPADFCDRETMPFYWMRRNVQKPEEKVMAFAHSFLGVRIECAQCHKHPFDQWTKTDFEQFQAFFEPVRYGGRDEYNALTKSLKEKSGKGDQKAMAAEMAAMVEKGDVAPWQEVYIDTKGGKKGGNEKDKKKGDLSRRVLTPKLLGGDEVMLTAYADPREPVMDWLRDKGNPYFAPSIVNRVWAAYFGRGIVDPPDDLNLANPPVNAPLMDHLVTGFIAAKYDLRWLHRQILNSHAYQRSWKKNETNRNDEKNFSRMVIRRLPAEVAADALTQATAISPVPLEKRAIGPEAQGAAPGQKGNTNNVLLTLFGKPARETNCDCERNEDPTLLQTLFVRNDKEISSLIESKASWINELRNTYKKSAPEDLEPLIREAFLRTLSRSPSQEEIKKAREDVGEAADPITGLRDLMWALLNTREFMVNH